MKGLEKIKVIGVGGSGGNAISRMFQKRKKLADKLELIAVNCDLQDLRQTKADIKVQIGKKLTKGFGAGANPEIGYRAAMEQKEEIRNVLKDSKIVFITCGLGGGTGTKGSAVIAEIAKKNLGILTVGIVTLPFTFEGLERRKVALSGLKLLKERVDSLIVIENDRIFEKIDQKTNISDAFWRCDEVLQDIVFGMAHLLFSVGFINVDFADIKEIMKDSGNTLFGIGKGQGENKLKEAALKAIEFPFSDISIDGAKGLIFNIFAKDNISLMELEQSAKVITDKVFPSAKIIFGITQDKSMKPDEAKIIVIATGIER